MWYHQRDDGLTVFEDGLVGRPEMVAEEKDRYVDGRWDLWREASDGLL